MFDIVISICISVIIIVALICATIIFIRKGNYRDIVLNDNTYQAAIAECNKLSGKISIIKEAARQASISIDSDCVKDSIKIDFARYVINQVKSL